MAAVVFMPFLLVLVFLTHAKSDCNVSGLWTYNSNSYMYYWQENRYAYECVCVCVCVVAS